MASPTMLQLYDCDKFPQILQVYLDHCSELHYTTDFINKTLPNILTSIGNGKSHLNVIGVGSGGGSVDLEMLSQLHLKHPGVLVDNEVVEPSSQQLHNYREMVNQKPDLDYINFTWNEMTASEFEEQWKEKNITKKADFIHMVQMLYYVKDPAATINFFHSLLDKNGKLLIIQATGESAQLVISKTVRNQLCLPKEWHASSSVSTADIKSLLEARGVPYQSYELQFLVDVTECFTEGDETGDMLLDFLTNIQDFNKTASPELRQGVLRMLQDPKRSMEKEGRIMVNSYSEALVINSVE